MVTLFTCLLFFFFFFSSRRRHTRCGRDWSSDVCSSDLDLRDDIFRIMAINFDELGDWDEIEKFYAEHGERFYEYRLYDSLASLHYSREYYRSAASTLREFVLRYP